jgi:hypothetical protein
MKKHILRFLDVFAIAGGISMYAWSVLSLSGCATQISPLTESSSPSYDGNDLNSGVIALVPGGQLVTPHWRDRYNGMIAAYGSRFTPALQVDDGIVPATAPNAPVEYFIDDEHAVKFDQMNEWRKADAKTTTVAK